MLKTNLFHWGIFTTLLFACSVRADNVYQVEMIVFERSIKSESANAEQWSKNIELTYPGFWQRLLDPAEEAAKQAELTDLTQRAASDDFLQVLAAEGAELAENTNPNSVDAEKSVSAIAVRPSDLEDKPAPDELLGIQNQYKYLPRDQHTLQRTREALDRNNQLRVIFHQAWVQPVAALEQSPALILHGGNRYGEHHELQGYIYLGISRYLHLQTHLWLSRFTPNQGQTPDHWPNLPLEPEAAFGKVTHDESNPPLTDTEYSTANSADFLNTTTVQDPLAAPYLISEITTLFQKRRMRSGELHYIDHPRLGVLIKLSPQNRTLL